jgi:hypothetical protein
MTHNTLCGLDFFAIGGILLIKCCSVRRGIVFSDGREPGNLYSTALAFFTNSPSISWILNSFACGFFLWAYWHCGHPWPFAPASRVIMKMIVEKQMEYRLAGETEVLGENLSECHFCPSQNPTWPAPGLNLGRRGGKPATNRLSYGTAFACVTPVHYHWIQNWGV